MIGAGQALIQRPIHGFKGTYSEVTSFTLPESAEPGLLNFVVEGHLFNAPTWPNFAVAFFYEAGPMAKITVTMDGQTYEVTPGTGIVRYVTPLPSPSYRITLTCSMTLEEGAYSFSADAGWYDVEATHMYYDDQFTKTVSIETVPSPLFEWWIIAAIGGTAAVILIVGLIAYEERERIQEQLILKLGR